MRTRSSFSLSSFNAFPRQKLVHRNRPEGDSMKRSAPHHGNISRIPPVCTLLSPLGVCRRRRMFRFVVSDGPRAFTKTNDVEFACTIFFYSLPADELPNQRSPAVSWSGADNQCSTKAAGDRPSKRVQLERAERTKRSGRASKRAYDERADERAGGRRVGGRQAGGRSSGGRRAG